jgi:hypothetical protein
MGRPVPGGGIRVGQGGGAPHRSPVRADSTRVSVVPSRADAPSQLARRRPLACAPPPSAPRCCCVARRRTPRRATRSRLGRGGNRTAGCSRSSPQPLSRSSSARRRAGSRGCALPAQPRLAPVAGGRRGAAGRVAPHSSRPRPWRRRRPTRKGHPASQPRLVVTSASRASLAWPGPRWRPARPRSCPWPPPPRGFQSLAQGGILGSPRAQAARVASRPAWPGRRPRLAPAAGPDRGGGERMKAAADGAAPLGGCALRGAPAREQTAVAWRRRQHGGGAQQAGQGHYRAMRPARPRRVPAPLDGHHAALASYCPHFGDDAPAPRRARPPTHPR